MTTRQFTAAQLLLGVVALVSWEHSASAAVLVPTNLDISTTRPVMPGEGLLENTINPFATNSDPNAAARPGQEYTGWIDIRSPVLAGGTDTLLGYDRYDRQINQATTILTDKNNAVAGADVTTDLDHTNTAYARQAGVSVIERSTRGYKSPAAGAASFDFPLSHGLGDAITGQLGQPMEEQAIMGQNVGGGNVNVYYAQSLVSNALGETYHPSFTAGLNNEAIFMANKPVNGPRNTLAHELTHYMTDGDAIFMPNGGNDGAHSMDPRNLVGNPQYDPGQAKNTNIGTAMNPVLVPFDIPNNDTVAGPVVSTANGLANGAPKVGGISQLTTTQVFTTNKGLFGSAAVSPYLTKGTNATAANRVDWNFATDDWITENLGGGADTYPGGRESLYFTAGNPTATADPAATADNGGKNKTGLGVFNNPGAWAGNFNYVDVFSLNAHYGDYDVNNGGDPSFRASDLDYDVSFVLANNSIVAGIPVAVYTEGWSEDTFADDWLARWKSPSPAKGVLVTAHQYLDLVNGQKIGNAQIDAVIASNFVPEPATIVLMSLGLIGGLCLRKRRV
jgi:hypothetical protein